MKYLSDYFLDQCMYLDRFHHGKEALAKERGDVIVSKENGVKMGEVRMWWWTDNQMYDTPVLYVADREFKKWWPFKNVVWWRRIDLTSRAAQLESFVDKMALVANHEGWQGAYFKEARDISKAGFLRKLKEMKDE